LSDLVCGAELRIPGDLLYLRPVRAFVRELADNTGFNDKRVDDIELAVDEVFSNAVEHGSDGCSSQVVVRCSLTDEKMGITVSDTGRGKVSDTSWLDAWSDAVGKRTRLGTERGHGLLLARNLADEMRMESNTVGGVDVHLVIYREGRQNNKR